MEDLGEAVENFVETFSCTEEPFTRLSKRLSPEAEGNLLAASPYYGYSFAAVGSSISVYNHASLRDGDATPAAIVDLKEGNVTNIHSLSLGTQDTVLALVTIASRNCVVILNIPALVSGKIHALPSPSRQARAFAVGESGFGSLQTLATVEEGCIQLHSLSADGSAPTTKITISNALCVALSPDSCFLAVGTERGSVVVYDTETGKTRTTIVEVESGWVPFSIHFADNRAILASYSCDVEVRHVVWHLSQDGAAVSGHSALGELCLASLSFDSEEEEDNSDEAPSNPSITCISLHDWAMCVVGSSKSGDVEIIRKTENGWEVWKFDEGKSPTLPNDDNDDDTCCVGLAFDVNNIAPIPGPDAASPKINPMPRVIVYTSDSLLLPFALIDGAPGITCDSIRSACELPLVPESLRSIQTVLASSDFGQPASVRRAKLNMIGFSEDSGTQVQDYSSAFLPLQSEQEASKSSESEESATEVFSDPNFKGISAGEGSRANEDQRSISPTSAAFSSFGERPSGGFDKQGVNTFLGNFSSTETSVAHPKTPGIASMQLATEGDRRPDELENYMFSFKDQEKQRVMLAPSLEVAETEASRGDLFSLLKSIMTEMSEELRVSTEAEHVVSREIASQKDGIVSSVTETRKQLSKLLEETRTLFRSEADLRSTVSKTLSKVLAMSREYEKMSLEFRVRKADGFSRSLRAEDKEIDEKIGHKEKEVIRSISSIEERLSAEANIQTRKSSPAEVVQQVYSSLRLQGIRIKRIQSLLAALNERMDNQDKGGRLSHLGLSLARLETLNIHDEVPGQSQSPDVSRRRQSGSRDAVDTSSSIRDESDIVVSSIHGDDTQLLSADVRAVMRRLAMSGGRASITTTVPPVKSKISEKIPINDANIVSSTDDTSESHGRENIANTSSLSLPVPRTTTRRSLKQWSTANARKPHDTEVLRQDPYGNGQIATPSFPAAPHVLNSKRTTKAGGEPSSLLPPKRPPSQAIFVSHRQPGSSIGSRPASGVLDNKRDEQHRQSRVPSIPQKKPHDVNNEIIPIPGKNAVSSPAVAFESQSTNLSKITSGLTKTNPQEIFGTQIKSEVPENKRSSGIANPFSLTPAKSKNTTAIPFADLPPDNDPHEQTRDNKHTSGLQKSEKSVSVPFAGLPPDDDFPERNHDKQSAKGMEKSSLNLFADLPPDDNVPEQKQDKPSIEGVGKSSPRPFVTLPPDDELPKAKGSEETAASVGEGQFPVSGSQSQDAAPKRESSSGLFAALPPDPDKDLKQKILREEKTEKLSLQPQEQKDESPGILAALHSDSDDVRERGAYDSGRGSSSDRTSTLPSKAGAFGTNDLFAMLPPEDSGKEQAKPFATLSQGSIFGTDHDRNPNKIVEGSKVEAAATGKTSNRQVQGAAASPFGDGANDAPASSPEENIFGSNFETNQQSSAPFGKDSLFGANSSVQQSITTMIEPRGLSLMDSASSDDSEEETTRFSGGMDTSSNRGGFFAASSSAQSSKQPFEFGSSSSNITQPAGFTSSGVSPFASLPQSSLFGQSSVSQSVTQTGFGSLSDSDSNLHSSFQPSRSAFGETPSFGVGSASPAFGTESSFGASTQQGAAPSFGMPSQLGGPSAPFGSSSPALEGSMAAPKFGETSFSMTPSTSAVPQNSSGSGFGNNFSSAGASPFGQVAPGNGFGGASGGGSGFAALAGSQSGPLIFGNGGGPPAFTGAAFSERRI